MSQSHQSPPPLHPPINPHHPSPSSSLDPQSQHQQQHLFRDYRKGNWTVQETLTLITAKRLDDDRRSSSNVRPQEVGPATPRSAEQRWKWVENYCWRHSCLRSQNQCNDKWDNLLRDYKKVRDYEAKLTGPGPELVGPIGPSYWALERHQRKERNLPTNLSPEVFQALTDVLSRRNARRNSAATLASPVAALPPPPLQHPPPQLLPPPAPHPPQPRLPQPSVSVDLSESEESEGEDDEPEMKRRKMKGLGSGMVRGASVLARTLMACEEKREQRHRELLEIEERRLKLEEERNEMNKQAVSGLISAVSGLSNAINALVSGSGHRGGGSDVIDNPEQL